MRSHSTPRVVIEGIRPRIDGGRFPIKRVPGDEVVVEADVFADGHDAIRRMVRWRRVGEPRWNEKPMAFVANDPWQGTFVVTEIGRYEYTASAWIDRFATWRRNVQKKLEAGQDVSVDLLAGAELVEAAERRTNGSHAEMVREYVTSAYRAS